MKSKNTKTDFKGWTLEEMPQEVIEVIILEYVNQPIGLEMMKKVEETKKKYPEFFKQKSK